MERESMIETKQHLLWVKPRYLGLPWVNRQREKYLGLSHHLIHDGCLFGQEPLAARDCIAQHQTQCSLWAQTEVHVSYMRTVWWEDPSQEGAFVFMHTRGFWEEAGRVNREDCRGTSSGEDICPRYPCTFSLVSDTEQEERTQKSTGWKKWQNLPFVFNTLQAKAFLWIPSMINWIWDWNLNWTGLCISNIRIGRQLKCLLGISLRKEKGTGTENVWKEWLEQKCSSHVL